MLHTNNPIIKYKVGLLNLSEELSNVSNACKIMGVSKETFCRYQELVDNGGGIETAHPSYLGCQNIFYIGNLKGVGRLYQQPLIDSKSKVVHCKLYTTKTSITAADLLNDKVLPFYKIHNLPMLRIFTDRGTQYCSKVEQHDYLLYLAINVLNILKPRLCHLKLMVFVRNFIKPYHKSFTKLSLARNCMIH